MNKIIFITPYFERSGSEIALFNLIVRIKGFEVIVISKRRGALSKHLPSNIRFFDFQTFRSTNKLKVLLLRIKKSVKKSGRSVFEYFLDDTIKGNKALFYVNTLVMPDVVAYLKANRYKFVLHVHELQQMLRTLSEADVRNLVEAPDLIFTSSNTSKRLLKTLGRNADLVETYPCLDFEKISMAVNPAGMRAQLQIPANAFVITMSGTIDFNKDPEGFLEIGRILKARGLNIYLLWLGVDKQNGYLYFLQRKVLEYGLTGRCAWIGKLVGQDYYDHLSISDCFVLTSFRESFSIVLLEALALGKPVFSFQSGGPEEIINSERIGLIVAEHSMEKMSDAVEQLIKGEVQFDVEMAKRRVNDFSADAIFDEWFIKLKKRYLEK